MSLTNKQRIFVEEYPVDFNATRAAKAAGYSDKTAYSIGQENLKKPEIAEAIQQRIADRLMSANEALARTAAIARGDLTDFITSNQEIDIDAMRAAGQGHLLKKFKRTRRVITTKDGDEIETITIEAELYPADAAQDRILRHHGSYVDRHEISGPDGGPIGVTRIEVVPPPAADASTE